MAVETRDIHRKLHVEVPTSTVKHRAICSKCEKVMETGVTFQDKLWHKECFTCSSCPTRLAGTKFTSQDGRPYCFRCYGKIIAHKCSACTKPIYNIGDGFLIHMDGSYWHVGCFVCNECGVNLLGELSVNKETHLYCTNCASCRGQ